jgi:exosortase/archaeosortase family protein
MRYPLPCLFGPTALIVGLILLAAHPLLWLVQTWLDPAYDSQGLWVAVLVGGLLLWSTTSPLQRVDSHQRLNGISLLALTALLRLLGQWLGINTLGAAALAVDVYAIGLLLGLQYRARPLAPGWLALLFAFACPSSASCNAASALPCNRCPPPAPAARSSWAAAPVQCEGLQLQWHEQVVLVDLPCSGTRGLLLLLLLFVTLAALTRPGPRQAVWGALLALAAAALGNSLRIVALAVGLVHREALGGVDVFAEPWHSTMGLCTLTAYRPCRCCCGRTTLAVPRPLPPTVTRDEPPPPFPTISLGLDWPFY